MKSACLALFVCALTPLAGYSQESVPYRVLPVGFNADKENQMMRAYQRKQVHAALDHRLEQLDEALRSQRGATAYQRQRRAFLARTFGPLPERQPLNARVTGRIERTGYRIEKVLFESSPGFPVTANLYRPHGDGPFPGVLLPCGHSANGKSYSSYQKACILLAQHGFVVFCFDPIGQGERRQLIGARPGPVNKRSEHNQLGVAPILLGRSLGSMMVWDGVRAIDYLCSRRDVDATKIGCTGNSGGGNLTSYLMAFDHRIMAAAPGCFMTTHRRKNERPGPGDAEQNLFAQIRDGFDHADFILTRAPSPTLILSATDDYVPIEGAWESFRQAKRFYTVLGYPERVDLVEVNEKHGFSRGMREACVRFMARWLKGRKLEVFEDGNVETLSDADLRVTAQGQVRWLPQTKSIFDVFADSERALAATRKPLDKTIVRKVTGIRALSDLPEPKIELLNNDVQQARAAGKPEPKRLILRPEPGIALPALYWEGGQQQPVLLAPAEGMNSVVDEARRWRDLGHSVLIIEVRDTGETKTRNWRFYGADSFIGQMLGRSWLAMRAEDLLIASRWLARSSQAESIQLHADGETVPAALHARYLEPALISQVASKNGLASWRELMTDRQAFTHIHQAVHGALQYYDLPDLLGVE